MNWQQMSRYRIESESGYIITRSRVSETSVVYVARAPKETGYVYVGSDCGAAKSACDSHLLGNKA